MGESCERDESNRGKTSDNASARVTQQMQGGSRTKSGSGVVRRACSDGSVDYAEAVNTWTPPNAPLPVQNCLLLITSPIAELQDAESSHQTRMR